MLAVAPYYTQHIATRGTAISETEPHEGATYPYPVLITLAKQSDELVFNLTRAMHEGFDDYRNADPFAGLGYQPPTGLSGWCRSIKVRFDTSSR